MEWHPRDQNPRHVTLVSTSWWCFREIWVGSPNVRAHQSLVLRCWQTWKSPVIFFRRMCNFFAGETTCCILQKTPQIEGVPDSEEPCRRTLLCLPSLTSAHLGWTESCLSTQGRLLFCPWAFSSAVGTARKCGRVNNPKGNPQWTNIPAFHLPRDNLTHILHGSLGGPTSQDWTQFCTEVPSSTMHS